MKNDQQHDELAVLNHNLTNHAPAGQDTIDRVVGIRVVAKLLGRELLEVCPPSHERSLAITNLEQTVMWAVASIARNQ